MLFDKNDNRVNEIILYKTKPNMILGCKKAIYGVVLLGIVLYVSPLLIRFVGEMQVYMISYVKMSLTRYAAIAFFVVILIIAIYIIWQLVGWYSTEYALTDSRIIIKSGVLSTKKNYMPYATIQDINTSQSILARLFNVGSVSVFSAYDNNQMVLENISNPSKAEEIIFSNMVGPRSFQEHPQRFPPRQERQYYNDDDYMGRNDYYDEFEPITPITHENNSYQGRNYEYYPEDLSYEDNRHTYEYEPYNNGYDRTRSFRDESQSPDRYSQDSYYNEIRDEYFNSRDNHYQNHGFENEYDKGFDESRQNESTDIDSQEKAIRRHFDKFKK